MPGGKQWVVAIGHLGHIPEIVLNEKRCIEPPADADPPQILRVNPHGLLDEFRLARFIKRGLIELS